MKKIKKRNGQDTEIYEDEFFLERVSAMGLFCGEIIMPLKMKNGIIKTYFDSGAIRNSYLYIDGKEITDGKNYNNYRKL